MRAGATASHGGFADQGDGDRARSQCIPVVQRIDDTAAPGFGSALSPAQ